MRLQEWAPWCFSAVVLMNQVLIGRKNYWGWLTGAASSVCGIAYNLLTHQIGFIVVNVFLIFVSLKNFQTWRSDNGA